MRRYYLHTRHNGTFYAELIDPQTGTKLIARSTGTKNRDEALLKIAEWLKSGIPTGRLRKPRSLEMAIGIEAILKAIRRAELNSDDAMRIVNALKERRLIDVFVSKPGQGSILFTDYLRQFWDYKASPYVREKQAHGQTIGENHCRDITNAIRGFYDGYFGGRPLNSITRQDMKDFSLSLTEKREKPKGQKGQFAERLSAAYVNKIIAAGTTALKWAFKDGIIPVDPTVGLMRFSGTPKKRGILSPKEVETVFKVEWLDKRAYVASLLACTTGLRLGEVLAIRKDDIGEKILFIRHSWNACGGLKSPKNGEERKVPLLPAVREKLLELLAENPYQPKDPSQTKDLFIFYGLLEDRPINGKFLLDGLHAACKAAGIDSRARGICFHSWRHSWVTFMTDRMEIDKVAKISGHKTRAMAEHYADHVLNEAIEKTAEAGAEVFANILQFPVRKGA